MLVERPRKGGILAGSPPSRKHSANNNLKPLGAFFPVDKSENQPNIF